MGSLVCDESQGGTSCLEEALKRASGQSGIPQEQSLPTTTMDTRLLEQMRFSQGVPLFICAPAGTGRTSLAVSYARHCYNLKEVLWLDATSKDLDDALNAWVTLGRPCKADKDDASSYRLIVIDDLSKANQQDASTLSDWIDFLVESGSEVLIITTPENDSLRDYQSDRFLVNGQRLIAAQKWTPERQAQVLRRFLSAPYEQDLFALAALMMLMERGIVDELRSLGYAVSTGLHSRLKPLCPLIEIDELTGFFDASRVPAALIAQDLISWIGRAPKENEEDLRVEERSFERLTQLSSYLFERSDRRQSQFLLELAGTILIEQTETRSDDCERQESPEAYPTQNIIYIPSTPTQIPGILLRHPLNSQGPVLSFGSHRGISDVSGAGRSEAIEDVQDGAEERPQVIVRLFGEFELYKGGRRVENAHLHRSKVRALLIHLALNMGKGVARDTLMERIWPEKDYEHAKDNYYATWSRLNRILATSSRDCPYLFNDRGLCRLNTALVTVDVQEFEWLAKKVLFAQGSIEERIEAVFRIEQLYRGDLLSGHRVDLYVESAQLRLASLLVDVMLEASQLFSHQGNDNNAIWFARKAYDVDPSREDVYRILMDMQDRAGQRTSALRTYFDCKRFLGEELGILPSQKTTALYQELILDRR